MTSASSAPPRPDPLRVIIADDDPFARRMIKASLQAAGIVVIAEAADGREAVALTTHYEPDVVLMDVVMPVMDGMRATQRIVAERPDQFIVLLSNADDGISLLGLTAGASGFLSKDVDVHALPRAVEAAVRGEAAISRLLSMDLIKELRRLSHGSGMRPVKSRLSSREWEVLDLLCVGTSTDDMAHALVVSTETVRSHVKKILHKLDVHTRAEAVEVGQRLRDSGADA